MILIVHMCKTLLTLYRSCIWYNVLPGILHANVFQILIVYYNCKIYAVNYSTVFSLLLITSTRCQIKCRVSSRCLDYSKGYEKMTSRTNLDTKFCYPFIPLLVSPKMSSIFGTPCIFFVLNHCEYTSCQILLTIPYISFN